MTDTIKEKDRQLLIEYHRFLFDKYHEFNLMEGNVNDFLSQRESSEEKEPFKYPTKQELSEMLERIGKEKLDKIMAKVAVENRRGVTIDEYFNGISGYPDTEADGITFCGKCGKQH